MNNKIVRRRLVRKINLFVFCFLILYILSFFGIFTHLFEQDISKSQSQLAFYLSLPSIDIENFNDPYIDVNKHVFKYIHNSNETCDDTRKKTPYLVILIKSKYSNFEQRLAIRETWGNITYYKSHMVKVVFLLGMPNIDDYSYTFNANKYFDIKKYTNINRELNSLNNLNANQMIEIENFIFNDIVQQNFIDSYYNNTLKAIMGLRWIEEYCVNSRYYLFIDDDQFLNPNLLFKYLKTEIDTNQTIYDNFYGGFVYEHDPPLRNPFSPWYLSLKEYPFNEFPPFVPAGFYILSSRCAKLFSKATRIVKKFKFDDIYLAIIAHLLKIKPLKVKNVYNNLIYKKIVEHKANEVLVVHGISPTVLRKTWNIIKQNSSFFMFL